MLTKKRLAQLSNFQGCHLFSLLLKYFFSTLTTQQSSIEKVELFQGTNKLFCSLSSFHLVSGSQMGGGGEAELQGERAGAICRLEKRCWLYCERPFLTFSLTSQTYETFVLSWSLNNAYLFDGVLFSLLNFFYPTYVRPHLIVLDNLIWEAALCTDHAERKGNWTKHYTLC